MKKGIFGFLCLSVGGTIGFAVANKVLKEKYEQITQDEIDSIKEAFRREHPLPKKDNPRKASVREKSAYRQKVVNLGYIQKTEDENRPKLISQEEFIDNDPEFQQTTITYFSDDVLVDDNDRKMDEEEIEDMVGQENLDRFKTEDDDTIFVRNNKYRIDYEIIRELRTYSDFLKDNPHLVE